MGGPLGETVSGVATCRVGMMGPLGETVAGVEARRVLSGIDGVERVCTVSEVSSMSEAGLLMELLR